MPKEEDRHKTMSTQELAQERTSLAGDRTALANQRTFSAWLRTGLSSVLAGLAIVKFIGNNQVYKGFVLLIGLIFEAIGIGIYILSYITYRKAIKDKLEENKGGKLIFILLTIITFGLIIATIMISMLLISF